MESYSAPIRERISTDVLVVGTGAAGATATIAAATGGADVVAVERYGFMGGISTQVLDTFYGFYTPGDTPRKVVGGVPDRLVARLEEAGACIRRANTYGAGTGITYDPEILKCTWERLALDRGARLRYHSFVLDALGDGDRVEGVVAATKQGLIAVEAEVVIDCSGDADVAVAAGAPHEGPGEHPVQAMTTTFTLVNVDVPRARAVPAETLHAKMEEAAASGRYDLPRREGSVHHTPRKGVMATNMVRVADVDGTDPAALTEAEVEGRRQALEYARFLRDCVPGYEDASVGRFSTQIGVRESRRIEGAYRLSREDVLSARSFEDVIGQCGAPIEEHHSGRDTRWEYLPEGETYQIPYRTLLPRGVRGLLVAGRCCSADHDAHASVRNMGQCMLMGQAAGVAAALAVCTGRSPEEISVPDLQERLRGLGAILGEPPVAEELID